MKTYVSQWQKLPRSIAKEYKRGDSVEEIANRYKSYTAAVRTALRYLNVQMRPPGHLSRGKKRSNAKLTERDVANILNMDDMDISHTDIARKFDISRERIRQICLAAGHKTRNERIVPKAYVKYEQRMARRLKKAQAIKQISDAWKSGMSFDDIGSLIQELLGLMTEGSDIRAATKISYFRKQYGHKLFPYRRGGHWTLQTLEERAGHIKDMADDWNTHASIHHICKRFGYASYQSASAALYRTKKQYPHLFKTKAEIVERAVRKLTQ